MNLIKHEWRFELPSTLESIERCCAEFQRWHVVACAGLDAFSTELLLREALTNSVVHGCREDPSQRVSCLLRARRGRLLIAIRDEGSGFDWRAEWSRQSDLSETRGRGIEMLRRFASSVRFNPKGNAVLLVKRF